MTERYEVGACCICEKEDETVRNLIMMDYKNPVAGSPGWGCVACGLTEDGALAAICDECLHLYANIGGTDHIRFLMGLNKTRIPVPDVDEQIPHRHNAQYHGQGRDRQ